ncbi:hypothetical protein FGLOB1_13718 [Fusarium globosum]|uniref:F-box domain-containing protein n=1 Tax=Fusarium globosum TaxID=78864 RepID=A0A8H6CY19_9HYPO|nr:hypothetical protein FGLOB1_13718 [Fusarium globosum]
MPIEIVCLLVELLDIDDVFNMALSCRLLSHILFNERMCRMALMKVPYSTETHEAHSAKNFPRAFRKLAKRRMAVRAAEPWMVAIVAMADCFIYTNGHLCYTVNSKHLRVLNTLEKKPTSELTVDVTLLLMAAVRDYDPRKSHTFEPLYYAQGVLSCLATQISQDSTTCSWLLIFELRESPRWVVVQRSDSRYPFFVRNDKDYLIWGSKSHVGLDGSYRWSLRCLNLQTRKWEEVQMILWDFDEENIGSDICFEIIDGQFYCVANTLKTEAEHGVRNNFYQVVRFPVDNASHGNCEKPLMRNLWRRHESEGAVDERWTSLQLSKDEKTGELFIVETRKEWFPGNAGSQRTCYKKMLRFGQQKEDLHAEPELSTSLGPITESLDEEEWSSEVHAEERSSENTHIGDGPTDLKAYNLHDCFVRSYNPACDTFIDLISEAYNSGSTLQLRVQPKNQVPPVIVWPQVQQACHHNKGLAQLQGVVNPIQPIRGIEWSMDDRSLVYSPTYMASGQLRPVILISFDPELILPGFPNYVKQTQDANKHSKAASRLETSGGRKGTPWSSNQDIGEIASPSEGDPKSCANLVRLRPALYQTMSLGNGDAHGFDLSYPRLSKGLRPQ